jgi:hypothetical protein
VPVGDGPHDARFARVATQDKGNRQKGHHEDEQEGAGNDANELADERVQGSDHDNTSMWKRMNTAILIAGP